MFRKFFSVILAVALVLMPMASLAEGETMSATIKLSDPKLTIVGLDEIDMTGLDIVLSSAYDLTDADNPVGTITAQVLANGVEAIGAAVGINKEKAVGVLNGLQKVYGIKLADAMPGYVFDPAMIEEFMAAANTQIEQTTVADEEFEKAIEELFPMNETGKEQEIDFRGEKVNAKVYTVTLTAVQFEELITKTYGMMGVDEATIKSFLTEANMDLTGEFTFYEVDDNRVYVEGVYTVKQKANPFEKFVAGATQSATEQTAEEVQCYMTMSAVTIDDANVDIQMNMEMQPTDNTAGESVKAEMKMVSASSDAFKDAVSMDMTMVMTIETATPASTTPVTETATMTFALKPQAATEGWNYDYDFDMNIPGEAHIKMAGKAKVDGEDVAMTFVADDLLLAEDGELINFGLEGKYAQTEDTYKFDGTVSLALNAEGTQMSLNTKVAIDAGTSVEGQILPIDSMDAVDAQTMTETELEELNTEATGLMFGVMEKLMKIPGLATIIQMGMSGMTDTVVETPTAELMEEAG